MNSTFQQAIAALQRQLREEKSPAPEVEEQLVGKFGISSREVNPNIVEVGRIVKRGD